VLVTVFGAVLCAAGLVLGFGSVHASNVEGDCGSVFGGAHSAYYGNVLLPRGDQCAGPISDRRTITWAVLAPCLVALASAGVLEGNFRNQQRIAALELSEEAERE
jgi:hypothetical protein